MEEQINSAESITLTKNAKGDYQWIIKVKEEFPNDLSEETLKRLKNMNDKLEETYGKK